MESAEDTRHLHTTQSVSGVHHNNSQKQCVGQKKQPARKQGHQGAQQMLKSLAHEVLVQGHCSSCMQEKGAHEGVQVQGQSEKPY